MGYRNWISWYFEDRGLRLTVRVSTARPLATSSPVGSQLSGDSILHRATWCCFGGFPASKGISASRDRRAPRHSFMLLRFNLVSGQTCPDVMMRSTNSKGFHGTLNVGLPSRWVGPKRASAVSCCKVSRSHEYKKR